MADMSLWHVFFWATLEVELLPHIYHSVCLLLNTNEHYCFSDLNIIVTILQHEGLQTKMCGCLTA